MKGNIRIGIGGIPTELDVRKLEEKFGVPKPGQTISYQEIAACIGNSNKENRFWSVTNAWRNKLFRENNIVTEAIPNEGFEFLDAHKRVSHSVGKFKGGLRKIAKGSAVAASTDRAGLTQEEVRVCDHVQNTGAALRLAAATAARQISYQDPVKEKCV